MARFSQIVIRIQDLEPRVALHAMIAALKPKAFIDSLCKKRSTNDKANGQRSLILTKKG